MGVSRRMKKQGPPPPLDESKISSLKRRKTDTVDDAALRSSKRRRAEDTTKTKDSRKQGSNGIAHGQFAIGKSKGSNAPAPSKSKSKSAGGLKSRGDLLEDSEAESSDHDADDLLGVDGDEFSDIGAVSEGSMDGDSDDEGSRDSEQGSKDNDSVLDSEEDDKLRDQMFSDDEGDSDAGEKLTAANIEGLSRKLDQEREADEAEAQQELQDSALQTNIAGDQTDVFAEEDADGNKLPAGLTADFKLLRTRITDTIRILGDLSTLGKPGKSRTDYTSLLLQDICTYYGYTPYLAEKLFALFTPREAFAFFEANESPRPVVIRTNTLRTNRRSLAQALINRGVVLEPVGKWSKVGLQVFEAPVPLGATPEYLAGHYILQAASSFLPVMALAPQPHERILDMAAAPGGKTTYMSALMRNTGSILANDANKERSKGLIGNIHRLGCKNTIVSNLDATAFPKALGGFDRVLLDAPCSGTGVISKDAKVKTSKTERDFLALPHMQKQLLLAAVDSTNHASKTGGYIVYSTCSVTVEENEGVIDYILRKRPNVKIVDTGLGNFGSEGFKKYKSKRFHDKMTMARRYFPHRENVDGFFVCKLKKTGPSPKPASDATAASGATPTANEQVETWDKTPITTENGTDAAGDDGFGGFDDEADDAYIARAERNKLRRKGLNPKAVVDGKEKAAKKDENEKREKQQSRGNSATKGKK